jgi:transcriptional regulator with XRE-family HTH domain
MSTAIWRIRRNTLGLRQRDVADRAEISQSRYSLLERGEAAPTTKESEAINQALELPGTLREELRRAATGTRQPEP